MSGKSHHTKAPTTVSKILEHRRAFLIATFPLAARMPNLFFRHLESWLSSTLRAKAIASAREERLVIIGASDLATMLSDYVLTRLIENPTSCWSACELDQVSDQEFLEAIHVAPDVLAASFIGAVLELAPWQIDEGVGFLVAHGVPAEDAREFCAAVDVVADKLALRGQVLVQHLDYTAAPSRPVPA